MAYILLREKFDELLSALWARGYRVLGPTVKDAAIVYDEVRLASELPEGWTDEQGDGYYRLKRRSDLALFGYVVGPSSWKRFLHPPVSTLWKARREKEGGFSFVDDPGAAEQTAFAFLGVRSCELHAIAKLDRVMIGGSHVDESYRRRREKVFLVAVNCTQAGKSCFCESMNTGPEVNLGCDLLMTEIIEGNKHYFVLEGGTAKGEEVIAGLTCELASESVFQVVRDGINRARKQMGKKLETAGIKELLYQNLESPHWEKVAERCLGCANCTMVCPTCFCSSVEDVTDLSGDNTERQRKWDSCFSMDFSSLHGLPVRQSTASRYRQWLVHKLGTWQDQFGSSGCVGCGRCISWCPVGIDLTAEVKALRESDRTEINGGTPDGNN